MLISLRRFFAAPVFPEDEDKTRLANWLNIITLVLIAVRLVVILRPAEETVINRLTFDNLHPLVAAAAAFFMLRRGQVRLAAAVLLVDVTIGTLLILPGLGGLGSPFVGTFVFIMALAALTLGEWGIVGFTVLTLVLFSGFAIAETSGTLVATEVQAAPQDLLFGHYVVFIATGVVLWLTTRGLGQSLRRAQQNEREVRELAATLEKRVAERTQALETSAEVSRRLSTILDQDQLVLEVVEQVKTAYNYYHAHIYLLDESGQKLVMMGGTGEAGKTLLEKGHTIPVGRGIVGRVAQFKQGLLVPDTAKEKDWLPNPLLPETKAEVAVPIVLGDELLGVLDVQDNVTDQVYPADVEILQAIANQVAVALQNARRYEEARRLFEGGQALAAAKDHQTMLDAFMTYGVPQADRGALLVAHTSELGELLSLEYAAAYSRQNDEPQPLPVGTRFSPEQIPFWALLQNNQPLIVTDVKQYTADSQLFTPELIDLLRSFDVQAMVSLPLFLAGQLVGALLFGYAQPRSVNEREFQPIQTLTNQVAILLQNQRLFAETQSTLQQLNIINRRLTGQSWQEFTEATGALQVEDIAAGLSDAINGREQPDANTLTIPLQVRGTAIGQFTLQHLEKEQTFSAADHDLLQEIADEVALALENIRLVEQTQKNAAALEASRSLLNSVIDNLPLLLFVKDAQELRYVTWNKAGEELLGIAAADVLGKNAYDSFTLEEADRFTMQDREVLSGTNYLDISEETVVTPRGVRILHTRKTPVYGPDGQPQYLIGLSEDITEQKEAQAALATSEAQLAEAIRIAQMANWEYDVLKDEFTFNDQFYNLMRTSAEQEGGYTMSSMQYAGRFVHPEDAPVVGLEIQKSLEATDPNYSVELDHRVIFGDGEPGYVTVRFRIEKDATGRTVKTHGANQDITARKQAEAVVAKRAAELESVTQLVNTISTVQDPLEMLQYVSDLTKGLFNFYHAHVYLLDEQETTLELAAGASAAGQKMVAQGHTIALDREQSLVARAARTRQGVIVNDVAAAPDFLMNPLLPDTRSELAVPLIVGDRVLGVLDVQSNEIDHFQEEDLRIMSILAAQIAVALDNARANEQNTRTLRELDALTRRLTHEGWQSYLTDTSREQLAYLFEGDRFVPLEANGHAFPTSSIASDQVYVQSVKIHGEEIGRLVAEDVTATEDEDEYQIILEAVAQGLSTHLDNLRLNEQTERALAEAQQRTTELNVLNELGSALTTADTVDEIVQSLRTYLPQLIPANDFYIAFNRPERDEVEIRVFINGEPYSHFTRARSNGVTEYILQTRQPIFIQGNLPEVAAEKGFQVIGRVTQAFMGVPMNVGQEALGVIAVQSEQNPYQFTNRHLDLLAAVASQSAIAISNIYLITQTQTRAEELAMINRVVSAVASSLDIRESLQAVADELAVAAQVDQIGIALFNEGRTELTIVAEAFDPNRSVSALGFVIPVEGNPSTQEVMRTRKPLVIAEPLTSPLTAPFHEGLRMRGVQALTIFPILVGEDVVGTVGIDVLDSGRTLTPDQMRLAETIIYQASIAINNVRLFEQTQQALQEVQVLYDVSIQVNAARTMPEILLALTQPAMDAGASATGMFTFEVGEDQKPEWGVVTAVWQRNDVSPFPVGTRFALSEYPAARIWLENPQQTLFVENILEDERIDEVTRAVYRHAGAQGAIWIPFVSQNRWLGLIYISWAEPRRFSPGEQRLYEALRTQGTTVVENRLLYEQSQARAAELGVINQVAETVARQLDPDQVMESVYHQVQRVMVADAFLIGLYDRERDEVAYPILYDNGQRFEQAPIQRDSQSYIYQVIDTGRPVFVNAAANPESDDTKPTVGDAAAYPESIIYVPLFSGTQVTGAMSVQSYSSNAYDEGDVTLLSGIANHVALALENARLFAQTQERATELATINEMSRIASSQLSLSALIQAVGEQLQRTFDASGVYVSLYDASRQQVSFPYFMETDDGERKLVSIPPRSLSDPGITGRIVQTRQPVLVTEDTVAQMTALGATTTDSGPTDVESYLGVPMIVGDEVIGVIAVQNDVGQRRFDETDQALLMTLATTIGVAVQNARQFETTRRRARRERLLNEITQKIQGSHTREGALQTAVKELGQALKAKYARVEIAAAAEPTTNSKNGG